MCICYEPLQVGWTLGRRVTVCILKTKQANENRDHTNMRLKLSGFVSAVSLVSMLATV
jgi:hypothetical protein